MYKYETKIVNIGSEAEAFKEESMMILFGENAPADLADYSYHIIVNPVKEEINVGDTINFDNQSYEITAVGNVVSKNLSDLGHITLRFIGDTEAKLPGTLYIEEKELPKVKSNTVITIE